MAATMKRVTRFSFFLAVLAASALVRAAPPERDLLLEVRQIEEGSSGYVVSTRPQAPMLPPQQVQVRNGREARIRYAQSIPLQWVQAVQAAGPMTGAGVKQGLVWLQAGQSLVLRPRWPGGQQAATVEVEMQTAAVETRPGADLPTQQRSELATTVRAPLGQWVTIARSGQVAPQGSYSSEAASQRPRLLQLRVTAP